MKKHFPTSKGAAELWAELFLLDSTILQEEATDLFSDTLGWIARHFELTIYQLEILRGVNSFVMQLLGASLATALLARRPIVVEGLEVLSKCKEVKAIEITMSNNVVTVYKSTEKEIAASGEAAISFKL